MYIELLTISVGKPAIIFGPNNEIVDILENPQDVADDYYRMLDEADEDE